MRTSRQARHVVAPIVLAAAVALLLGAPPAGAASAPVKEIVAYHVGSKVNKTTGGGVCAAGEQCQPAAEAEGPGAFMFLESLAGNGGEDVYVADRGNNRVQELTRTGQFVLMFGKGVNRKGGDTCSSTEQGECQTGVEGSAPGQFGKVDSIVVDRSSGDIYVAERQRASSGGKLLIGSRVQEFSPAGAFIREIGKEVNETAHINHEAESENLCPVKVGDVCKGPALREEGTPYLGGTEHGSFNFGQLEISGNILSVGGTGVLYVGDDKRVQEFDAATGAWTGEIPLAKAATAVAANQAGEVYVLEGAHTTILTFEQNGKEIGEVKEAGEATSLSGNLLAIDPSGRVAVGATASTVRGVESEGTMYEVLPEGFQRLTSFKNPFAEPTKEFFDDLAFDGSDDLYVGNQKEVISYQPKPVAELRRSPTTCTVGGEHDTDVSLLCTLKGDVDPWGVPKTSVWFEWGRTHELGETTIHLPVSTTKGEGEEEPLAEASEQIQGLRPAETFYERLAGEDANASAPETLTSTKASFRTATVPPRIIGQPTAAFVTASSAVIFGALNPENAKTRYEFQYAADNQCDKTALDEGKTLEEACQFAKTQPLQSSTYGRVGTAQGLTALQPVTVYHYRLVAVNEENQQATNETGGTQLPQGSFETAPSPIVQAETGAPSQITTTTAILNGAVNPDGQAVTFAFEMGIYDGAATQFTTVETGSIGPVTTPVQESHLATGLQPGTTYAFRMTAHSGEGSSAGSSATGSTSTFTTVGLTEAIPPVASPQILERPPLKFPTTACKPGFHLDKHNKCIKAKHKKGKKKKRATRKHTRSKHG